LYIPLSLPGLDLHQQSPTFQIDDPRDILSEQSWKWTQSHPELHHLAPRQLPRRTLHQFANIGLDNSIADIARKTLPSLIEE